MDARRFSAGGRASGRSVAGAAGHCGGCAGGGICGAIRSRQGIRQLVEAFERLRAERPELRLLLVGDFEEGDPIEAEVRRAMDASDAMVCAGFVADTAPYYALMDVLALPTYREGFPGVPLEAQASGVPVVTTFATGAMDSVVDGETGYLVPVGDSEALAAAIGNLLDDPQLRLRMGTAGRARMERDFRPEAIWDAQVKLYRELMESRAVKASLSKRVLIWWLRDWVGGAFSRAVDRGNFSAIVFGIAGFVSSGASGIRWKVIYVAEVSYVDGCADAQGQLLPDAGAHDLRWEDFFGAAVWMSCRSW